MAKKIPPIRELLKVPNINENILNAFSKLIPQPRADRIPKNYPYDFSRKISENNHPFSTPFYGIYVMRWEWLSYRDNIESNRKECPKKVLETYIKKYAAGFHYGYLNFEKDIVEVKAKIFNTDENKSQIIFDYASLKYPGMIGMKLGNQKEFLSSLYNNGVKRGYYYKAWYLILENHKIFEDYFINIHTKEEPSKTTYKTSLSDSQLQYLFDSLKKAGLIHSETSYELFKAVFSKVDITTIQSKIKWLAENNLLAYFIDKLKTNGLIEIPVNHWDIAKHCFYKAGNLRQAKDGYENSKTGQPKQALVIDKILNKVYSALQ